MKIDVPNPAQVSNDIPRLEKPKVQEQSNEQKEFRDYASQLARSHVAHAMRPPLFQFPDVSYTGGARYADEAISKLQPLKMISGSELAERATALADRFAMISQRAPNSEASQGLQEVRNFAERLYYLEFKKQADGL